MVWTHRYDLLAKIFAAVVCFGVMMAINPESRLPPGSEERVVDAVVFAAIISTMVVVWLVLWRPALRPASTWLYVWRTFGVRPSWAQARELSRLFALELSEGLRWTPCDDVVDLDLAERLPTLLERAEALRQAQAEGFWERTRVQSKLGRMLQPDTYIAWNIVVFIGMLPVGLGALARTGPAAFLADWTPDPILSLALGVAPLSIVTWAGAYGFDRVRELRAS